ncbi:MAG TPA: EAL domain-containing protein [Thermoanaerobaculia bacterium]|jgi:diguanylate cyclase (GGDEF)-like protein/PAS domain S-box-containing protein|nr:EAL domain-containing protein [Thermoanaerobaculia bacterium]
MDTPLRVLLVAASRSEAEPFLDELRCAGYDVTWEIVRDRSEMEGAVSARSWDVVLSQPELPGFGPLSALEVMSSAGLDAPFLVVSDATGDDEETPVLRAALPRLGVEVERTLSVARLRRERRMSRKAVRESESRFRALAEIVPDVILTTDPDGLVLFANRSAERVFGHDVAAVIGRPIERLLPGLLPLPTGPRPNLRERVRVERDGLHASGRKIPIELFVASFSRDGRRLLTVVARDLTDRKRAEAAVKSSEALKSAVIEAALDAIVTVDAQGRILEFNPAAERMFGFPRDGAVGQPIAELIVPPSAPEGHRQGMARYLTTGETAIIGKTLEMTAMRSDGSEFPIELTVTRLPSDGDPIFTAFMHDVSERTRAETALRESEERFRVAAQISTDLVYEWDLETGKVVHFVSGMPGAQSLPSTREEWENLLHPDDRERVVASVRRTLETGQLSFEEYRVVLPDGSVRVRIGYGKLIRDAQGRPSKWIGVNKDVTERRRTEVALKESEQKLRTLVGNVPIVLFAIDRDGTFTHSEGKGLEALGITPREVVGRSVEDVYRDHPDILDHIRRALAGEVHTATVRIGDAAFETRYAPYRDDESLVGGVIGVAMDVSERWRAEQALRASESRYRTLYERNLAGVFRATADGWLLDCNESFARIFGYASPAHALRQPALDFYLRPGDRNTFLTRLRETGSLNNFELAARRRDGTHIWVLENATLVEGPDGVGPLIEGTVIDITERKRAEEQVRHLAFHDALTGLPNRLLFNDRLTMALAQAHRGRQKLATLFLDLDRFKVINDSLGHGVGDELLRRVADRLRVCTREEDTVARLGGDEFIVLVPRLASDEDAEIVARKILSAIRLPFAIEDRDYFLTTSMGVSLYPIDGIDAETLVQNADTAMYRAKDQGRDNYQLYAPAMNTRANERLSLENRLRQALQRQELVLYYQPIVDLSTGRVRGAEALLRWRHPERGLLPPAEFITLAEISGLITPIGKWVLETACEQIREWQALGHPRLTVSVNLSPRQFQQADLVSEVAAALAAAEIEAGCLDLEITESSAMENAERTINTLWELRRLGVGISLDDFGTGYSSLNYLKRFPIDRVKLDRSFVRDVVKNSEDAAIVRAIIAMAHTLKMVVVAEGVETEDQLAFLRQHQCDEMQGFLFSPPVASADLLKLLVRRQAIPAFA